jgi:hypothetical protein
MLSDEERGAAEIAILGDNPPRYIEGDVYSANAIARIICRTDASRAAFVEHTYQEALAIIEENKPVVLALGRALTDHREQTFNATAIDAVIAQTLAPQALAAEQDRRVAWRQATGYVAEITSQHDQGNIDARCGYRRRSRNYGSAEHGNNDDGGKRLHRGQGFVPVVPKLKHAPASIEASPIVAHVSIARQHDCAVLRPLESLMRTSKRTVGESARVSRQGA